jgi:hypothetical protein
MLALQPDWDNAAAGETSRTTTDHLCAALGGGPAEAAR